jgi:hypothetical protein
MTTEQEIETGEPGQTTTCKHKVAKLFSFWKNPTDRFAFLLVIVTFLLFIATAALYCATSNLVTESERTAAQQLRAYLVPSPPSLTKNARNSRTGLTNFTVSFAFDNTGQTPAYDVRTRLAITIRESPLVADLKMQGTLAERAIVGKVVKYSGLQSDGFDDGQIREIASGGNQRLYMRGHTCYASLGKAHHISFCFAYLGDKYRGFDACGKPYDYEDNECPNDIFTPFIQLFEITPETSLSTIPPLDPSPTTIPFDRLSPPPR